MRRLSILGSGLLVAAAYFVLAALPAFSAGDATVDAQVHVQATEPCITLESTSIDFGSLPFSTPNHASGTSATPDIVAHSCSSATERLFVRGTNATGPTALWTLAQGPALTCALGTNIYLLSAYVGAQLVYLRTDDQEARDVAAGESVPLSHSIQMPCVGSDGASETMTMQIVYTTSF